MKRELRDILACPLCRGELELNTEDKKESEIISGSLYCRKCAERYPIVASLPSLLPPDKPR